MSTEEDAGKLQVVIEAVVGTDQVEAGIKEATAKGAKAAKNSKVKIPVELETDQSEAKVKALRAAIEGLKADLKGMRASDPRRVEGMAVIEQAETKIRSLTKVAKSSGKDTGTALGEAIATSAGAAIAQNLPQEMVSQSKSIRIRSSDAGVRSMADLLAPVVAVIGAETFAKNVAKAAEDAARDQQRQQRQAVAKAFARLSPGATLARATSRIPTERQARGVPGVGIMSIEQGDPVSYMAPVGSAQVVGIGQRTERIPVGPTRTAPTHKRVIRPSRTTSTGQTPAAGISGSSKPRQLSGPIGEAARELNREDILEPKSLTPYQTGERYPLHRGTGSKEIIDRLMAGGPAGYEDYFDILDERGRTTGQRIRMTPELQTWLRQGGEEGEPGNREKEMGPIHPRLAGGESMFGASIQRSKPKKMAEEDFLSYLQSRTKGLGLGAEDILSGSIDDLSRINPPLPPKRGESAADYQARKTRITAEKRARAAALKREADAFQSALKKAKISSVATKTGHINVSNNLLPSGDFIPEQDIAAGKLKPGDLTPEEIASAVRVDPKKRSAENRARREQALGMDTRHFLDPTKVGGDTGGTTRVRDTARGFAAARLGREALTESGVHDQIEAIMKGYQAGETMLDPRSPNADKPLTLSPIHTAKEKIRDLIERLIVDAGYGPSTSKKYARTKNGPNALSGSALNKIDPFIRSYVSAQYSMLGHESGAAREAADSMERLERNPQPLTERVGGRTVPKARTVATPYDQEISELETLLGDPKGKGLLHDRGLAEVARFQAVQAPIPSTAGGKFHLGRSIPGPDKTAEEVAQKHKQAVALAKRRATIADKKVREAQARLKELQEKQAAHREAVANQRSNPDDQQTLFPNPGKAPGHRRRSGDGTVFIDGERVDVQGMETGSVIPDVRSREGRHISGDEAHEAALSVRSKANTHLVAMAHEIAALATAHFQDPSFVNKRRLDNARMGRPTDQGIEEARRLDELKAKRDVGTPEEQRAAQIEFSEARAKYEGPKEFADPNALASAMAGKMQPEGRGGPAPSVPAGTPTACPSCKLVNWPNGKGSARASNCNKCGTPLNWGWDESGFASGVANGGGEPPKSPTGTSKGGFWTGGIIKVYVVNFADMAKAIGATGIKVAGPAAGAAAPKAPKEPADPLAAYGRRLARISGDFSGRLEDTQAEKELRTLVEKLESAQPGISGKDKFEALQSLGVKRSDAMRVSGYGAEQAAAKESAAAEKERLRAEEKSRRQAEAAAKKEEADRAKAARDAERETATAQRRADQQARQQATAARRGVRSDAANLDKAVFEANVSRRLRGVPEIEMPEEQQGLAPENDRFSRANIALRVQEAERASPVRAITTAIAAFATEKFGGAPARRARIADYRKTGSELDSVRGDIDELTKKRDEATAVIRDVVSKSDRGEAASPEDLAALRKARDVKRSIAPQLEELSGRRTSLEGQFDKQEKGLNTKTDIARGFLALGGGAIAGQLLFRTASQMIGTAADEFAKASHVAADALTGFSATAVRVNTELAGAVRANGGNVSGAISGQLAGTGISAALLARLEPSLGGRATAVAATQNLRDWTDAQRTARHNTQDQIAGVDKALLSDTGGLFDSGFGPDSQKGFIQTLAERSPEREFRWRVGAKPDQNAQNSFFTPPNWAEVNKAAWQDQSDFLGELNKNLDKANSSFEILTNATDDQSKAQLEALSSLIGFDKAANLTAAGITFARKDGGQMTPEEMVQAISDLAKGGIMLDPGSALQQDRRGLEAQGHEINRQFDRNLNFTIPVERAMQRYGNPLTPAGAGLKPLMNLQDLSGFGGLFKAADQQASLKQTQDILDRINARAEQGRQIMSKFVPKEMLDSLQSASNQIATLNVKMAEAQSVQTAKEYAEQLRIAKRTQSDIVGLAGVKGKVEASQLGILERENMLLGRKAQLLQFEVQQRQINLQLALAGFQTPGETSEERAARRDDAEAQAKIAQQQLNIGKSMFGNEVKIVDTQNLRQVQDIANQISNMQSGFKLTVDMQIWNQQKAALEQDVADIEKEVQEHINREQSRFNLMSSEITKLESAYGQAISQISMDTINGFVSTINRMYGAVTDAWGTMDQERSGSSTGSSTSSSGAYYDNGKNASGTLFNTSGTTSMIVGEAGTETVAVLRNPRQYMGGMGGSGSVTINITGNYIKDDNDIAKIARAVEDTLNRKLQLQGLR